MLITKKWSFIIIKKVTDVKDVNIEKQSYLMHMAVTKARKHMQNTKQDIKRIMKLNNYLMKLRKSLCIPMNTNKSST